jgi:hypothetical protein
MEGLCVLCDQLRARGWTGEDVFCFELWGGLGVEDESPRLGSWSCVAQQLARCRAEELRAGNSMGDERHRAQAVRVFASEEKSIWLNVTGTHVCLLCVNARTSTVSRKLQQFEQLSALLGG